MRRTRVLLLILSAVALSLVAPGTAAAGNTTFYGDLNGDGRSDRITLGSTGSARTDCTITVSYRIVGSIFRAPVVYPFTSPAPYAPFCPNKGEAVDLGGDGVVELVTTHFIWTVAGKQILVLRNFVPWYETTGVSFPSTINQVDFNGDGRKDIWESSDQTMQVRSYLNTTSSTLVPGPISVCNSTSQPQHVFADFNGDGGQDMLMYRRCEYSYAGAELHFGNGGTPVVFASTTTVSTKYEVYRADFDYDGVVDVGVITQPSGGPVTVRHFRNNGAGVFTEIL
ncbi:hypothetical protein [Alloactinosynnema sp. L-07]|uniref:FG-GAP repeat domain-containing protein n=1 Tax=Alloactinosynnema sp. L-07 TaxID=1653480 RepID=UPI00065F0348|nr:VCBS repeat-containing protein [Alloactinosynnema sp. L-07]CRK62113.1 hypothetical protein [Alloactinosynnema sp. L-07]